MRVEDWGGRGGGLEWAGTVLPPVAPPPFSPILPDPRPLSPPEFVPDHLPICFQIRVHVVHTTICVFWVFFLVYTAWCFFLFFNVSVFSDFCLEVFLVYTAPLAVSEHVF